MKDLKQYYKVGDKLLCFIPRTGSTSLLSLIEEKYYPQNKCSNIDIHFRTPSIIDNHKSEMCAMFRNPIERFISGCAQKNWTVEQGIEQLQKERVDFHIKSQHTFLSEHRETKLFRFPEQVNDCAEWLGLPTPVPFLNVSKSKPEATQEQIDWLKEYYKKDLEIFNNI